MPMHINIGTMHQRGMRCNMCPLVKSKKNVYVSGHITGNAVDFTCDDKTAEEVR
nr:MAG: Peptidase M15 [Bacteriophage sp.]